MKIKYKMGGKLRDYPNVKVTYVWVSPNWKNMSWYKKPIAFVLSCIISIGLNIVNLINGRNLEKMNEFTDLKKQKNEQT